MLTLLLVTSTSVSTSLLSTPSGLAPREVVVASPPPPSDDSEEGEGFADPDEEGDDEVEADEEDTMEVAVDIIPRSDVEMLSLLM